MALPVPLRFALRELRGGLRGFAIFLLCLAFGVTAIAAVGTVRTSIMTGLADQGSAILGGDAQLEFTYRFASDQEQRWMFDQSNRVSEIADFRSMAVVSNDGVSERALTQVKAVDDLYPLVGTVTLSPDMTLSDALEGDNLPGGVMERILADRLGLEVGDTFNLGLQSFQLSALLVSAPDAAGDGFGLGPRTIVRLDDLISAGLLGQGSLFTTKYRLDLPQDIDLDELEAQADIDLAGSGLRWQDARNGAPGIQSFVDRLAAFLILVGLSGLAVGGIGVSSAVNTYMTQKTSVIATLKTLGASRRIIFQTYFIQIGILTILGLTIGLLLGATVPLVLAPLLQARLPIPSEFGLYPQPIAEAALYGLLSALIFTIWPLARAENVRPSALYRDAFGKSPLLPRARYLIIIAILLAALVAVAATFADNLWLTGWMAVGIFGAMALLFVTSLGIKALARWIKRRPFLRGRTGTRLALGAIGGPKSEASSVMLSLGLGLTVLAAVGQIDGTLRTAISGNLPDVAPSYFFVDIQKDQLAPFKDRLSTDPAVTRVDSAPMLRGIISKINGSPAKDVAGDHWVLNGDRGVSYAGAMPENTTITDGKWWNADYTGPPQISFAAEEALEMGLNIGDVLTLNILGRDIEGEITSFREVDFSTAGIGFILTMNENALINSPHTHIATVYADEAAEATILRDLAGMFPNITAIRVRDAIDRVAGLLGSLAAATSYGASATILTGFLVLIGAAAAGEGARVYEAAILKTLGASKWRILASFIARTALLGLAAALIALALGCLAGWAVATRVFETEFTVIWSSALTIVLGGVVATVVTGVWFAWRPLGVKPARILRAQD